MHIFIFISLCTKPGCVFLYSSDEVGEILANKGTIMLSFSTGLGLYIALLVQRASAIYYTTCNCKTMN